MARSFALIALLACLGFFTGCGGEARVATRNIEQIGIYLAEQGPDDVVRAAGRSIAMQANAVGEQQDLVLWGLLRDRVTKPTVTKEDWAESAASAERRSVAQAQEVKEETAQIRAVAAGFMSTLGLSLSLTGAGTFGLMAAWILKNLGTIKELGTAFAKMRTAETEDEAKAIEEEFPVAKKAIAKAKKAGKVL